MILDAIALGIVAGLVIFAVAAAIDTLRSCFTREADQ